MQKKIILITICIIIISFAIYLSQRAPQATANYSAIEFAQQITKEYRLKNDYTGLNQTKNNLFAGGPSGQTASFGAKNFYISTSNADYSACAAYLLASKEKNLTLISISINDQELIWGKGLPIKEKEINSLCQSNNKIIWQFL